MSQTSVSSDPPVLDLLERMTAHSLEASALDEQPIAVAQLAALVSGGTPAGSSPLNLATAGEIGLADHARGVVVAIAPVVGTTRFGASTRRSAPDLGVVIEIEPTEPDDDFNADE